ncbi:hypothetical protein [Elizabethkingia ursingii]
MCKNLNFIPLYGMLLLFCLFSCRTEDSVTTSNTNNQLYVQKFPDKDLNYIIKNSYNNYLSKDSNISNLYGNIDFRISSQVLKYENGNRGVIFPSIKENQVDQLILSVLSRDEKNIDFFKLDISEKENKQIKELFNMQYTLFKNKLEKAIHFSTNKSNINGKIAGLPRCEDESGGGNGENDDEDCRVIPALIITVPKVLPDNPGPDIVLPVGPYPGGGGGAPEISADTWATQHVDDSGIKDNKCANAVYQKLKSKSELFNNLLDKFDGKTMLNLDFQLKSMGTDPRTAPAYTDPNRIYNYGQVTINLNSDILGSPDLFIASLFIHEMFHAKIMNELVKAGWNGNQFKDLAKIDSANLPTILGEYYKYKFNNNIADHNYIANWYVDKIANALASFDNNQKSMDYYKQMAWGPLSEAEAWKKLPENVQNAIKKQYYDNLKPLPCGK